MEANPIETISADDILARYSNKGSTSVDNGPKTTTTADESHTETITVSHLCDRLSTVIKKIRNP